MPPRLLIVDDEPGIRESLRRVLEYDGYEVLEAGSGREGLDSIAEHDPDLVFLDIKMPHMDGLEVLRALQESVDAPPVVMISGHGTIATAVEATKLGAFDFLEKPLGSDEVLIKARNAVRQRQLERQVAGRRRIIGESDAIRRIHDEIRKAAPTRATVLITGESGTGKELVAHAVHRLSPRKNAEFVRVNCAAIPEELIESELFGHEKGSFTGASARQQGKFVQADGGTIFLDEIGDMSTRTQSKVLRVLQDGEVEPVGGKPRTVDVRVVAATNKDLPEEIEAGRFREDLYFRLNVLPIRVPPLRDRSGDVTLLVRHFIRAWSVENGRRPADVDGDALERLEAHDWPGNVRELENTVERLLIMGDGSRVRLPEVESVLGAFGGGAGAAAAGPGPGDPAVAVGPDETLKEFRDRAERAYLVRRLRDHGWNVAATARAIDTPRSNLYKKLEAYGIRRETDGDG